MARRKRKETKLKQRRKRQFRLKQSVVLKNLSLRLKWPRRKEQICPGPNPRQQSWPMILNHHLELLQLRSLHQYQELLVLRNILLFQELPALKRLQTRRQVLKPPCHWAYSRFLRRRCHRHQEHSAPTDWLSPSREAIHPPMHQHARRILSTMGPRPQDTKILHLHVLHLQVTHSHLNFPLIPLNLSTLIKHWLESKYLWTSKPLLYLLGRIAFGDNYVLNRHLVFMYLWFWN